MDLSFKKYTESYFKQNKIPKQFTKINNNKKRVLQW